MLIRRIKWEVSNETNANFMPMDFNLKIADFTLIFRIFVLNSRI
jgi:hypothetical protein